MPKFNITLSKAEFLFMREAMEEKFNSWMEDLDSEEEMLENLTVQGLNQQIDQEFDKHYFAWKAVQPEEAPVTKKPHWTQTAKGKKILARRRKKK